MLVLVAAGLSNAEIAARLGVGRPTVARTLASARRKLDAATSLEAAARVDDPGDQV
jgi:DNA-binding CsgD family transcriptional regulator